MPPSRLVPLIVASALFMENLDSTVIATALPAMARDLGTSPLHLSLAITSYLLALAVLIPASGWLADRFGGRNVFSTGIAVFSLGSLLCALSGSLGELVASRVLQGAGGSMMTPVGRLVLIRSVEKGELVRATAWLTVPALIGPLIGPPLGGLITTYGSWRWIFLLNLPIGLLGLVLVTRFIPELRAERPPPFDWCGLGLVAGGLLAAVVAFEAIGRAVLPLPATGGLALAAGLLLTLYARHAVVTASPLLDLTLLRLVTFRTAVVGGFLFRIGIGAIPVLLPLMLQVGFGLDALRSGLLTFAAAAGALTMKTAAATILRRLGFRRVLIGNTLLAAAGIAAIALFGPQTPHWAIFAVLLLGGFFRSLQFTSINTIAYAEVEPERTSRATSFASAAQQLSLSVGAGTGALVLSLTVGAGGVPSPADFSLAFLVVAGIALLALPLFAALPADAGAEISGHGTLVPKRND